MTKPRREIGDRVMVLDTANNRKRVGFVKSIKDDGTVIVYVQKWDTLMTFQPNGKTGLGRFVLRSGGMR
jgi:hypothetical protein